VRVGLPSVVLRLPRRVEHDGVERDRLALAAVDVVLDLGLVVVDVARLPEAVAPFGQQRRQPRRAQVAAEAVRRLGSLKSHSRNGPACPRADTTVRSPSSKRIPLPWPSAQTA